MTQSIIERYRDVLIEHGDAVADPTHIFGIRGASEEEIEAVKQAQGITYLPPLYEEFLRVLGNTISLGHYKRAIVPDLLILKQEVAQREDINPTTLEPMPVKLPSNAVIIGAD